MQVNIKTIQHSQQRYNTVGDWWFETSYYPGGEHKVYKETLEIRVSEMGDWRYEQAVAMHEYYEALLCYNDGLDGKVVDKFDQEFEASPMMQAIPGVEEPGDHPEAPYYKQHAKALAVEHMFLGDTDVVRYLYYEAQDELYRPKDIGILHEEGK